MHSVPGPRAELRNGWGKAGCIELPPTPARRCDLPAPGRRGADRHRGGNPETQEPRSNCVLRQGNAAMVSERLDLYLAGFAAALDLEHEILRTPLEVRAQL